MSAPDGAQPSAGVNPPDSASAPGSSAHAGSRLERQPDGWAYCERPDVTASQRDAFLGLLAVNATAFTSGTSGSTQPAAAAAATVAGDEAPAGASAPGSFTPEGPRSLPPDGRFERQPDGWVHCDRQDVTASQRDAILAFMNASTSTFAYKLADLVGYGGDVGLELRHGRAIYERPRPHTADELTIVESKLLLAYGDPAAAAWLPGAAAGGAPTADAGGAPTAATGGAPEPHAGGAPVEGVPIGADGRPASQQVLAAAITAPALVYPAGALIQSARARWAQLQALPSAVSVNATAIVPDANELFAGHNGGPTDATEAPPAERPPDQLLIQLLTVIQAARVQLRQLPRSPPLPLRLRSGTGDVLGLDTRLVQHNFFAAAMGDAGITLLELPGGLASGLQAALRMGFRIRRYVHVDTDPAVRASVARLLPMLATQHAPLLPPQSWQLHSGPDRLGLTPADLVPWALGPEGAEQLRLHDGSQWLVVTSWASHALWRDSLALQRLGGLQQQLASRRLPQLAFLAEGPWCAESPDASPPFGPPAGIDAVQAGSPAHRVTSLYTNLADSSQVDFAFSHLRPLPSRLLAAVLPHGRTPGAAQRPLPPPYVALQAPGQPLAALPPPSPPPAAPEPPPLRAGPDGLPCAPDAADWLAVSTHHSSLSLPAAFAVQLLRRHTPPAVFTAALAAATALHRLFFTRHDMQPLPPRQIDAPASTLGGGAAASGPADHLETAFAALALSDEPSPLLDATETTLAVALLHQRLLGARMGAQLHVYAAVAEAAEQADWADAALPASAAPAAASTTIASAALGPSTPDTADVWNDAPVMDLLRLGAQPDSLSREERQRVQRRAASHRWTGEQLIRLMPDGNTRVCPPPEARDAIVQQTHEIGHLGERRTLALCQLGYWWAGQRATVQGVVQRCKLCDMANTGGMVRPVQLQPLPIRGMFYRWGIDLAGNLHPTSPDGYTYVMVCVEHFTKWIELFPLTTKSASETARGLVELLTRFGSPAEVTTDRGTEFEGPFQALCEANAIDHRRTQPDHPQANGLAERMVQVVKAALRKHCRSTQSNDTWDKALPWLALAYRCSPQASTRYSPYKLLYGVDPIIPPAVRPRFEEHELAFTGDGSEQAYAEALLQRSEWLRRHAPAAAGNLLIAQHRDTQRYALTRSGGYRARALEFVPGDYVYLRNANPDNTLEMPVRDQVLRVEHVGDMGVAALVGRDTARLRARVEQLVPCHLPNLDPIQDARLLRTSNDLECEVCHSPQQPSRMLLCDGCGTGWHLRCLTPPLSRVPPGAWMCPGCVELGKAPPTGPAPQRPSAGPVLFPNADTRRRDAEAATLDGVSVVRAVPGPAGTPRQLQNGTLRFRGPLSRPFYFMVEWPGGSAEAITLADAKRLQRQTVPSSPASAPAQGGEPTAKRRVQPRR